MAYQNIAQPTVRIPLTPAPVVGGVNVRVQECARVHVNKELARDWRVSLNPIIPESGGGIVDVTVGLPDKPRARITWGYDGVVKQALVDWPMQGGSFSLWGDNVILELVVPTTYLATGGVATACSSSGYITPNAIRGGMRPTFSVGHAGGAVSSGGGFSTLIPVPAFARSVRWHQQVNTRAGNTAMPITINGIMDSGAAVVAFSTPNDAYTSSETTWPTPDGIPLTPDTNFILWGANGIVGDTLTMDLEFVLDLG